MITVTDERILNHIENFKGITINQCAWLFYHHSKFAHDLARKKLKALTDKGALKFYQNDLTKERIYCFNKSKKVSSHDLVTINLYAYMIHLGVENINFKRNVQLPHCYPDAIFNFINKQGKQRMLFVEVDMQNDTKIEKYEKLFAEGIIQREFKTFPDLVILTRRMERRLTSKNFKVIKMNYDFSNIEEIM